VADHFQLLGLTIAAYREGGVCLQRVEGTNQPFFQVVFCRNLLRLKAALCQLVVTYLTINAKEVDHFFFNHRLDRIRTKF